MNDPHKDEMLEGVVDAIFDGDEDAFQVFNDAYERAQDKALEEIQAK